MKLVVPFVLVALATLAGCSGAESSPDPADPAAENDLTKAPDFRAPGLGVDVKIDGRDAKRVDVTAPTAQAAKDMTEANNIQNNSFYAAVYQIAPASLADFDSNTDSYAVQKNMAYDFMFRADGSKPGDKGGFGWQEKWTPEYESMGCRVIDKTKALDRFVKFTAYVGSHGDTQIAIEKRNVIATSGKKLLGSFSKGNAADAKLYKCHWDNNDDTSADALLFVDAVKGEVRVVMALEGA